MAVLWSPFIYGSAAGREVSERLIKEEHFQLAVCAPLTMPLAHPAYPTPQPDPAPAPCPQLASHLVEWKPQGQSDASTAAVERATALSNSYKARKHWTPRSGLGLELGLGLGQGRG